MRSLIIYKWSELEALVLNRYNNACYEAALDRLEQIDGVRTDETTLYGVSVIRLGYIMFVRKLTELVNVQTKGEGDQYTTKTYNKALVRIGTYSNGFETIEVLVNYGE